METVAITTRAKRKTTHLLVLCFSISNTTTSQSHLDQEARTFCWMLKSKQTHRILYELWPISSPQSSTRRSESLASERIGYENVRMKKCCREELKRLRAKFWEEIWGWFSKLNISLIFLIPLSNSSCKVFSMNLIAESHCCFSLTDQSSSAVSWITR